MTGQATFQFDDGAVGDFVPQGKSQRLRRAAVPSLDHGHRARLRERFGRDNGAAMPDYELLELLLTLVIRQGDTKPAAKLLLREFGDLNHVMAAPVSALVKVRGVGQKTAEALKLVEAVAHRMSQAQVLNANVISSWDALLDYCRTAMAHQATEQFRVLFLDRKNVLIADEPQARGTVDHVPVYPREVVKRALELNASALILVHNHPSGDPSPSDADLAMTNRIVDAAQALGIVVHDHLIIGKGRELSFRQEGYL